MEKTARAVMARAVFAWSDIGGWRALWERSDEDAAGDAVEGDAPPARIGAPARPSGQDPGADHRGASRRLSRGDANVRFEDDGARAKD